MILAFVSECAPPARKLCQILTLDNFEARRTVGLLELWNSDHSFHREDCSVNPPSAASTV
jgi:hypothetical protein